MLSSSERILENVVYVLFRRKWMIIISFLLVFCSMIFFIWLITPTYKAMDRVIIHHNYKQQLGLFNDLATPGIMNPRINWAVNLSEIAKSTSIAEEIVKRFGLDKRLQQKIEAPESPRDKIKALIGGMIEWPAVQLEKWGLVERKPKDFFAEAVEKFLEDAEDIELVEDTEILEISVYEESPELSNQIVEALTNLLTEKALQLDRENAKKAYQYASQQLETTEKSYVRSRERLEEFKLRLQVTSFDDEKRLKLDHLATIRVDLSRVLTDLAGMTAELEEIHNRLKQAKISYSEYQDLINRFPEIELSAAALEGRKRQLSETIAQLEYGITQLIQRENEYLRLEKQAVMDEQFYSNLLTKKTEFIVQKGTDVGEFSIRLVDSFRVSPDADPDWPDLIIFLPVTLLFSLGVAMMLPFMVEFSLDYPRRPSQLHEMTGIPIWEIIPHRPSKRSLK